MKKIALIALASIATASAVGFYLRGSENATLNQAYFQGLDKDRLRRAYRKMLKDAAAGKYDTNGKTEEELNAELHRRYQETV